MRISTYILVLSLLFAGAVKAQTGKTKKPAPKPAAGAQKKPAAKPAVTKPAVKVPPGYSVSRNGLVYKLIKASDTARKANPGDVATIHYVVMLNKDSVFISSYLPQEKPVSTMVTLPTYRGCVFEGFTLMRAGDSAVFLANVDSLYLKTFGASVEHIPPFVKRGSTVMMAVRMLSVQTQAEVTEEQKKLMEKKKSNEFFNIEQYLASHKLNAMQTPSGIRYVKLTQTTGTQVEVGDEVTVHYTGKLLNDTVFESSYTSGEPYTLRVGGQEVIRGWDEGLQLMKEGEKFLFVLPFELAYGPEGMAPGIPPFASLVFEIEVVKVKKGIKAVPFNVQGKDTITTASGLKYIVVEKGSGPRAQKGQTATVHYTGYLENGIKFESSVEKEEPIDVVLGAPGLIKGWEEMLALMSKGDKVRVIIPYNLAYGERGQAPIIPPKATLVFDMEMVDVK